MKIFRPLRGKNLIKAQNGKYNSRRDVVFSFLPFLSAAIFGGSAERKKKEITLRSLRLCGEKLIKKRR